ncbi:MAG TPA: type II toxin-antitoxin system VapC family toxin [Jatrophihabitantaceae bacterium]|jgi:hypothetical protein|nr:type II toxin-antitoxin system VapC family toxin [Jatrophihabitantaceae bacterium]
MSFLLDTNVVSELRRPRPDAQVVRWVEAVPATQLYLSVLTIGELRQGIERLRTTDAERSVSLEAWISVLVTGFSDRIVDVDAAIAERWGRLNARGLLPVIDGLLAATAIERDLTLVTRNVADVHRSGVRTVNPFQRG